MKKYLIILFLIAAISSKADAQVDYIYFWYNGDQSKNIPVVLLSVDSAALKADTIGAHPYIISELEFNGIRQFLFDESFVSDSIERSINIESFDFTVFAKSSYMMFFTQRLSQLDNRFSRILEILKDNPNYEAIKRYTKSVMSAVRVNKYFPR